MFEFQHLCTFHCHSSADQEDRQNNSTAQQRRVKVWTIPVLPRSRSLLLITRNWLWSQAYVTRRWCYSSRLMLTNRYSDTDVLQALNPFASAFLVYQKVNIYALDYHTPHPHRSGRCSNSMQKRKNERMNKWIRRISRARFRRYSLGMSLLSRLFLSVLHFVCICILVSFCVCVLSSKFARYRAHRLMLLFTLVSSLCILFQDFMDYIAELDDILSRKMSCIESLRAKIARFSSK